MKKIITLIATLLLTVTCVFGLTACGDKAVKIGAQEGTTGHTYAKCMSGVIAKGYESPALAVQDMKNGNLEYVIVDKATALSLTSSISGIKCIDIPLTTEQYAIGVDKGQPELLTSVNGVLTSKQAEIKAIIQKYLDGDEANYVKVSSATYNANNAAGQLVVATNAEFAPFEFMDGDKYTGIDIEIAKLIADELGLELVIKNMDFDAVVSSIGSNNIDVALAALTVTASRKQSINFSNAYYQEAQVIVCLESNEALNDAGTVIDVFNAICKPASK